MKGGGGEWESHYKVTIIAYCSSPERLWLKIGANVWTRKRRQKLREQERVCRSCE